MCVQLAALGIVLDIISRLQLYGPVTKDLPASIFQLTKGTIYVSEDMARPIEPMDLTAY